MEAKASETLAHKSHRVETILSKKKTKPKPKLIRPRGMGLSVKLFKFKDLTVTASKIASLFKGMPYAPKKKKDIAVGFSKVKVVGTVVTGEFVAGFRVPVISYDKEGQLTPVHYISVDRGRFLIKLDKGTIEVRGSERIARKFTKVLEESTGANVSSLNLNGGTKKIYDTAIEIGAVLLTNIQKGDLTDVEFRGSSIQRADEIALYTKGKYQGEIVRFRGKFSYPSGATLTTTVNALSGSITVYKVGDGILEKDLNWIVELMEDAALGP